VAAEASILHQVARGDQAAMQACIDRFGGLVWSLARRGAAGASDADDAVQEIFIDLWKSASRFDPSIATETTFVAMIARRRLIDRGRRRQRRLDTSTLPNAVQPAAAAEPDVAERSEEASRAAAALERLRPEQQRVLQLSIYHGCSHEEISRATGLPLGTVKTHARRGLIRLREMLEAEGALVRDPPGGRRGGAEGSKGPTGTAGSDD
jgi:RNA polymerase sigma-70 factor (ECF subfamily)